MVDISENDISNSNVYISTLNPKKNRSLPAISYIKDICNNSITDVSLTSINELNKLGTNLILSKKGRNKEKGYNVYLKATNNDIILQGLPNSIFAVPEDDTTLKIKKNERLYLRYISTEGKLDFVSTGQLNNIARVTEGDYFINDFANKLEKELDTTINYDGNSLVFPNINHNTLIGIHTDDIVTSSILDVSMVKLTNIQNTIPFVNYNNLSNLVLTPIYLPSNTDVYITTDSTIAFNSNLGREFTEFNVYSVINNKKNSFQGKYILTTQNGYYFAIENKGKEDKIDYKSGINSLQEKRTIVDASNVIQEYLFIAGTIELYVNDDFGNINWLAYRQGSTNIIKTENALKYGSISNLRINFEVQDTSIQKSNIFTINEMKNYDASFSLVTALTNVQKQPFLFDIMDLSNNKSKLDIKNGTQNITNNLFENQNISILQLPDTIVSVKNAFNNNPIEKALLPTSISYGISDISSVFANNTTDISLIIYNVDEKKYYNSSNSQTSIKTDLSSLNTSGFNLTHSSVLEDFDIIKSKIVSLNSYTTNELQQIGIDASYTISNSKDLSFNLNSDVSFIIESNEFTNIDLSSIRLPTQLTQVGGNAFSNNNLKTIDLSGLINLTLISENAFDNNNITNVDFTNVINLQKIHNNAFNRNRITSVNLSQSTNLTEINDYAFYGSPITSLTLPNSLTKIGKYAFGFNKLTNLTLTGNIVTIDEGAFSFGTIENVDISGLNSLTTIGKYGFANNDISENIHLPTNLATIGVHAFSKNIIPKIIYNDELSQIGYGSFQENRLNNINLNSTKISTITQYAFYDNSYSKVMYLPTNSNFSKIERSAFENCSISNEQIINANITEINKYAFLNNKISSLNLTNADSLQILEEGIFQNNDMSGSTLKIPKNIVTIDNDSFKNSGISQLNFENFKPIQNVFLEPTLKRINRSAFQNNNITGILDIHSYNLEIIDTLAFDTNQITQVNFNINNFNFKTSDSAFTNNPISLMNFPIIWRLKDVGFSAPFLQKTLLYSYTTLIDDNIGGYDPADIDTILDGSDNIWLYSINNGILTVNDYTISIEANAFQNMPDISGLILNNDLKQIKSFAFNDCSLNGKITLPRDIISIGESAFEKNNITELDMSASTQLSSIGNSAFNLNNLTTLNFTGPMPILTNIGNKAFGNNINLETINFGRITNNTRMLATNDNTTSVFANIQNIKSGIFPFENDISINLPLIGFDIRFTQDKLRLTIQQLLNFGFTNGINAILDNSNQLWLYNIDNSGVMNIIPGVSKIINEIFKDNTNITKIIVPNSVEEFGDNLFLNNTNLDVLDLSNASGLNIIGENAFKNTSIKTLNLSSSLPNLTIKKNAFSDNNDLSFVDFTNMTNSTKLEGETISEFPFNNCDNLKNITIYSNDISLNLPSIGFPSSFTQEKLLYSITKLKEYQYTEQQIDTILDNSNNIWLYSKETQVINNVNNEVLTIIEGVKSVTNNVFENTTINKLILPSTIETIGNSSFKNNNMKNLDMSKAININSIGQEAFNNNLFVNLDFTIPTPNILNFGNLSFANNSHLTSVNFDDLSDNAILDTSGTTSVFYNTPNFKNLTINDNTNLKGIGFSVDFLQKQLLKTITELVNYNYLIDDIDTILTNINDIWLYSLYNGKLTLIDGVKRIEDNAFTGNTNINQIEFPSNNTLEYIGSNAFKQCNLNTPLTIPSRVEIIGNSAFKSNSISSLTFTHGNYLKNILAEAFNFNNYDKLIMRNYESLRLIGYQCFANNSVLSTIDFTGSNKDVRFENEVFINDTNINVLIIPFYWNPNEIGLEDTDYDKVINIYDDFINDPFETKDTDLDGVGDNTDVFPYDPTETKDTDLDGVGDNTDVLIYNPVEIQDTNNDGIGDIVTSYLESKINELKNEITYYNRKSLKYNTPITNERINARNIPIIPLIVSSVSNEIIHEHGASSIVQNELVETHCSGKIQPFNVEHHNSYKTYLQKRNKDYSQREFNFKNNTYNSSSVLLNVPTPNCYSTHKPNNKQFGIQGAVSSSNKILKEKNNNLTQNSIATPPKNNKDIYLHDKCSKKIIKNKGRTKRIYSCLFNYTEKKIILSNVNVLESLPVKTTIGYLSVANSVYNEYNTFALTGHDASSFIIENNNILKTNEVFNYLNKKIYDIIVSTSDGSISEGIQININDLNEPSTDISLSNTSVNENVEIGNLVGIFSTEDVDSTQFTYTITGTDSQFFKVLNSDLVTNNIFDYEEKNNFIITITANDGNNNISKDFNIIINNINEPPINILLSNNNVYENSSLGTIVGNLTTTDQDSSIFTYSLSGNDASSFTLDGNILKTNNTLNYEVKNNYELTIITNDGSKTLSKDFTINIINVNEAPTDIVLSNTNIFENQTIGTQIASINTGDVDSSNFTYNLTGTDANSFLIQNNILIVNTTFDYNVKNQYNITITTNDGASNFSKNFTFNVIEGNNTPTNIILSNTSIDENKPINSLIANLTTIDNDSTNFTYNLAGIDSNSFKIENDQLKSNEIFNYETKNQYFITINSSDGNYVISKTFTITINNVNEPPTNINLSNTSVSENKSLNTLVGTLSTDDVDSTTFTYTLSGVNGNSFIILNNNELRTNEIFNREVKNSYLITIYSTDGINSISKTFTINILNVNDPPTNISLSNTSIQENVNIGTEIGSLTTNDIDSTNFTYTLTGNFSSFFVIDGNKLKTNFIFNYEIKNTYLITIISFDGSNNISKDFTINIINVNDIPTNVTISKTNILENLLIGSYVGKISTEDIDTTNFSYILGGTDSNSFTISGDILKSNEIFNYETKNNYSISIISNDGTNSITRNFTINIVNIDDINSFNSSNGTIYKNYFVNNYNNLSNNDTIETLSINGQNYTMTNMSNNISINTGNTNINNDRIIIVGNGIPNYIPKIMGFDVTNGWNNIAGSNTFVSLKFSEENNGNSGNNNPNGLSLQNETFNIPLNPTINPNGPQDTTLGTVGVAINGIPIYNPFENQNQESAYGRIFSGCCGHPQNTGIYHYHKYPTCLRLFNNNWRSEKDKCDDIDRLVNRGNHSQLIGFALDGFPIYGPVGFINGESKIMLSSYTGSNDSAGNPTYVENSGDLDECNAINSPTPEFPNGVYHYVMTIESVNNEGKQALRYLNPYFGYDIRNILNKHNVMPSSWNNNDENYFNGLQTGFSIIKNNGDVINISGTSDVSYTTFYDFVVGMKTILSNNNLNFISREFETMKIAYPFTIIKYKGIIPTYITKTLTCITSPSNVNIISSNGNKYVFNNENTYVSNKQYGLYNGTYILQNVPINHPIAILNNGKTNNITYSVLNNNPIVIRVTGGEFNQPYYNFRDNNANSINIYNGTFKFMRGRTYRFADYGVNNSHPFRLYYSGTYTSSFSGGSNGNNYIDITIPSDHTLGVGEIFYQCAIHSGMKGNLLLLNRNVSENNEANGNYDFYYGNVQIVVNSNFDEVSAYCYYHGYMGGRKLLKYSSQCAP